MNNPTRGRAADPVRGELDRRTVLRRGAVLGGALMWSTPMVQSVASPAFAAGSPLCQTSVEIDDCTLVYEDSPDCCRCVESHPGLALADALALCATQGTCLETTVDGCGQEEEPPPDEEEPPSDEEEPPSDDEVPPPTVRGEQTSGPTVRGGQASGPTVRGGPATVPVPTVIPAGS